MSRSILITFFLLIASITFCQTTKLADTIKIPESLKRVADILKHPISDTTLIRICCGGDSSRKPLFVLNDTIKTLHFEQFILSPNSFESITILNEKKAEKQFGKIAQYGAIIIKTKIGIELSSLVNLFNKYAIDLKDRNLPVCINKYFIEDSNGIKADDISIASMSVENGQYNFYGRKNKTLVKFINIITKQ